MRIQTFNMKIHFFKIVILTLLIASCQNNNENKINDRSDSTTKTTPDYKKVNPKPST